MRSCAIDAVGVGRTDEEEPLAIDHIAVIEDEAARVLDAYRADPGGDA